MTLVPDFCLHVANPSNSGFAAYASSSYLPCSKSGSRVAQLVLREHLLECTRTTTDPDGIWKLSLKAGGRVKRNLTTDFATAAVCH